MVILKDFIKNLYYLFKKYKIKKIWRNKNKHNSINLIGNYNLNIINKIVVGNHSYGNINVMSYNHKTENLIIGNFVSIADNVSFILGGNHNVNCFSTYPYKVKYLKSQKYEATSKGPIIIEDDVWIGFGCIILSGVTIKKGAIIAAGSIVTKDVEEFSIYGGNPAKKIKDRYDDKNIIEIMKQLNFSKLNEDFIKNNIEILYEQLTFEKLLKISNELIEIGAIKKEIIEKIKNYN